MAAVFEDLNYDSVDAARAIRFTGKTLDYQLNMTQINKLLYIAYGILLVRKKQRLTKEHPAALPYGPVFPRILKKVKLSDVITDKEYRAFPETIQSLLNEIVYSFGSVPASQLSAWSHKENSPWFFALQSSNGKWNTKLNDEDIYNYFFNFIKAEV